MSKGTLLAGSGTYVDMRFRRALGQALFSPVGGVGVVVPVADLRVAGSLVEALGQRLLRAGVEPHPVVISYRASISATIATRRSDAGASVGGQRRNSTPALTPERLFLAEQIQHRLLDH